MFAKNFHRFASLLIAMALAVGGFSTALAAPSNDNFADAIVIGSLPFSASVDNSLAGLESNEPNFPNCHIIEKTVWYKFTPTETMLVRPEAIGGITGAVLNIYRSSGPGISDLTFLGCQATIFTAEAGQTYYLQVGSPIFPGGGGNIQVILRQVIPPANDAFANAETITSLPFSKNVDVTFATLEAREIAICGVEDLTIWYSLTPTENMLVQTDTLGSAILSQVEIYQSPGPDPDMSGLIPIGCPSTSSFSFLAEAGETYYFRVGRTRFGGEGTIQFNLEQMPPPVLEVDIDIRPGVVPNSINPRGTGTIPVAILSTVGFNALSQLDQSSLTFGRTGDEISLAFCETKVRDVNGDGLLDKVCHFNIQQTGFQPGDSEGILRGQTVDGIPIEGRDTVKLIKKN